MSLNRCKRLFSQERGSALVLVMFVMLMLTILGIAVVGAALGGNQRAETRENDVQSLHLTEKSLEEATAYILTGLNNKALSPVEIKDTLQNNITGLLGSGRDLSVITDLANAQGRITDIVLHDGDAAEPYIFQLTLTAQAEVNGVQRELQQNLTIDANPDFLKYALGSEGNVIINGSPLIQGNLYAGEELLIRNLAHYKYMGSDWRDVDTIYPMVQPIDGDNNYGEVYVQSLNSIGLAEGDGAYEQLNVADSPTLPEAMFSLDKVKIKKQQKFVQINVLESFIDKLEIATGETDRGKLKELFTGDNTAGYAYPTSLVQMHTLPKPFPPSDPDAEDYEQKMDEYDAALERYNNNLDLLTDLKENAVFDESLIVDGIEYKGLKFTDEAKQASKWLIVKGNLILKNMTADAPLEIRGNILVTGDVLIQGEVNFDTTMFVLGKATVDEAKIHGLNGKQLVLISGQDLLINRVDKFNPNVPERMDAFFYTEGKADIFGVGTTLIIKGGLFSKGDMTINAVVGQVDEPGTPSSATPLLFNGATNPADASNPSKDRRLWIIYDKTIYEAQQAGLPRVDQVNVTTGPIKLVPISSP